MCIKPEMIVKLFDKVYKKLLKEYETNKHHKDLDLLDDDTLLDLHVLQVLCGIEQIDKDMLNSVLMIGWHHETGDVLDFIIDIARAFGQKNDISSAKKLINILFEHDPNHYRTLYCFENMLYPDNTTDEYLNILESTIAVGTKQNEDVSKYKRRLYDRKGPAKDLSHAVSIGYYRHKNDLQKQYQIEYPRDPDNRNKNVYISCSCEHSYSGPCINVMLDLSNEIELPETRYLQIDEYSVPIVFFRGRVTLL